MTLYMYTAQTTLRNAAIIKRLSINGVFDAKREEDMYDVTRYLHVMRQPYSLIISTKPYLTRAKPVPR